MNRNKRIQTINITELLIDLEFINTKLHKCIIGTNDWWELKQAIASFKENELKTIVHKWDSKE